MRRDVIVAVAVAIMLIAVPSLALSKCYTNVTTVKVPVVGVTITPFGEKGIVGTLEVSVAYPGTGQVYVSSEPLTEVDTQGVARVAVLVASMLAHKDWTKYDFFFHFKTPSVIVGGPSAGIAMTVAVYSALTHQKPLPYVAGTGTISPDTTVGPVGGVLAKMKAAAKKGFKVFVIPWGEQVTYIPRVTSLNTPFGVIQKISKVKVNLIDEGKKLGIKVVPAATVYDALKVWVPNPPKLPKAFEVKELPEPLLKVAKNWIEEYLKLYKFYSSKSAGLTDLSIELLQRARQFALQVPKLEKSDPYEAVNAAFTAAILAERAYWTDKVAVNGFAAILNLGQEAQRLANESIALVEKSMTYDANKLDVLMTAASRALKSYYYYHMAMNSSNIQDVIKYLVYAKYYYEATRTWLQLLNVTPTGAKLSPDKLNKTTNAVYSSANGILGYLLAMNIPTNEELETALGIYKAAATMPMIFKLAAGMYFDAVATYTLHINYAISPENVVAKSKKASEYMLGLAMSKGIEPYVSMLYNYSANKLSTKDPADSVLFYELSAMHCMVLFNLLTYIK